MQAGFLTLGTRAILVALMHLRREPRSKKNWIAVIVPSPGHANKYKLSVDTSRRLSVATHVGGRG
jgi:hypothetical protein